jgi:TonB family protein
MMVGMRPAKIAMAAVLVAGTILLPGSYAQAQTTEAQISAKLFDKPLFLMGLWADDKLKFDAQGHPMEQYQPAPFTVCGMHVAKVSLHGSHLKLEGEREGITFDRDGIMTRVTMGVVPNLREQKPEKLSIEIDNGNSRDFGPAIDAVLTEDPKQLAPMLPEMWRLYFRKHFGVLPTAVQPKSIRREEQDDNVTHIGRDVQRPKLIYHAEPQFSEDARKMKYSGNVQVYLQVDEDGSTSHIMVVRPAGLGLDEEAVAAVRQYRFSPATRDGKPVAVDLYIDVNFQIF